MVISDRFRGCSVYSSSADEGGLRCEAPLLLLLQELPSAGWLVGWLAGCCQSGSGGVCLVSGLYQSSSNGWKPLVFK